MPESKSREVFLEYTRIGNSIRVVAIDAETGTEVVFQAPAGASKTAMKTTAINKLKYVMGKKQKD